MSLWTELKRRNVFRVGIAYMLLGWALLQGADFVLDLIGAPDWVIRALAVTVVVGLPIALFFAWAFELTPEGIKRESEVDRSESVSPQTGRKLDRAIIVFLVLVIAAMGLERFWPAQGPGYRGSESKYDRNVSPTDQSRANFDSDPKNAGADSAGRPAKSIAVLPFADLSQAQDQGWFADGLAEEILNALAKTPDLLVASRTSAFNYKNSDLGITEIAEELGVAHVLEGSVRSGGDRIRVTAQLIRASDGFHVWSENYDRDADDMIAIQEDVARSIAGVLETTMDPEALASMASVGTESVEAYRAYLQGVALVDALYSSEREFRQKFVEAYEQFERARALDPNFAAAHYRAATFWLSQVAPSRSSTGLMDLSAREALAEFQLRIDQAIATAPSDIDRFGYQGAKAQAELRLRDAIALYERYLDERPNNFLILDDLLDVAIMAREREISDRIMDQMKERGRTDPEFASAFINEAYRTGRRDEGADFSLATVERWPTDSRFVYQAHRSLLWAGRILEARAMAERHRLLDPESSNRLVDARQACVEGDRATAERILAAMDPEDPYTLGLRWHLLKLLGEDDAASRVLVPLEAAGVAYQLAQFLFYPQFDPTPFPSLMQVLEREGIQRPPPETIPFACPPPAHTSVAVLPFVNMSPDPDNEYFSDGVSEEILNVLAAVPDLKVASRTSAFRYKGSDRGIDEIAEELGVTHVLEGSVRKAGDQVRITAQLIQASDGFHLWSDTYDRQLTNIFAIQDEIAGSIAEVLQVQLLGEREAYTTVQDLSPGNYEKFLKARFLMRQRNENAIREAVALTRAVLEDSPDFPAGMTQLAEASMQLNTFDEVEDQSEIQRLAERALDLEPDLAEAHMINGNLAMNAGEALDAYRHLDRAIALDPSEPRPHHWLGILLGNAGHLERAREELQTAVDLEPDHANANGYLGFVMLLLGDFDGAQRQFDRQDRLGNPMGAQRGVQIAVLKGDLELAERLLEDRQGFGILEAERMRYFVDAARDSQAVGAYLAHTDEHEVFAWHLAFELMALGEYERALALDLGPYPVYAWSNLWKEARSFPAFQQKVLDSGLATLWDEIGPPPACRKVGTAYDCSGGSER